MTLLQENGNKKQKVKDITHYGPKVKSLWSKWGFLRIREGVLFREWRDNLGQTHMRYVVPESLRRSFFKALHDTPLGGHQGINRTLIHLQHRYYWPNMIDDVTVWCAQCHTCMKSKRLPINRRSPLQQQISGAPFERVAVDLMGPFEKTERGNLYIAVFQDYFTKWMIAEPLQDKTALGVADLFYLKWISLYGCPLSLHSDRGGEFKNEVMERLCDILRIKKTYTSPYHPEDDGMVERQNRTIQAMLRAFVNKARNDWDEHLPAVSCAYRSTPHDSSGVSPFRMVFGHDITLPIDLQNDVGLRHKFPTCPNEYVEWLRQTLYLGHDVARDKLKIAAARQKKNYQEQCRVANFCKGDWVWKVDSVLRPGKLHNRNLGPYLIINKSGPVTYEIQASSEGRKSTIHVDKLYPYRPEQDESLTSWLPQEPITLEIGTQVSEIPCQSVASQTIDTITPQLQTPILSNQGSAVYTVPTNIDTPLADYPCTPLAVASPVIPDSQSTDRGLQDDSGQATASCTTPGDFPPVRAAPGPDSNPPETSSTSATTPLKARVSPPKRPKRTKQIPLRYRAMGQSSQLISLASQALNLLTINTAPAQQ